MIKLRIVPRAGRDIKDACSWTGAHLSPQQSTRLAELFKAAIESLRVFPERGRRGRAPGTRELILSRVPFFIVYRLEEGAVIILSVQHQARAWPPD